jgi:hypothetical protein
LLTGIPHERKCHFHLSIVPKAFLYSSQRSIRPHPALSIQFLVVRRVLHIQHIISNVEQIKEMLMVNRQWRYDQCLLNGRGISEDLRSTARYYNLSAGQGNTNVQCCCGKSLRDGTEISFEAETFISV